MCILIPDLPKIPVIESRVFNQLFRPVHLQPEPYPRLMLLKRLDDLCRLFSPFSRQTEFPAPSVLFRNFQFQPPETSCQGLFIKKISNSIICCTMLVVYVIWLYN